MPIAGALEPSERPWQSSYVKLLDWLTV